MTDPLFERVVFRCGLEGRNRLALAPLTNMQSHEDGIVSDDELRWLERRAKGGFGLVSTCAAFVSRDGKGFSGQLGVAADEHEPGLRRLAAALKAHGALAIVQLYHGGARAPRALTGQRPFSAVAAVESGGDALDAARAASDDDVRRVIDDFVCAAQRAQRAGFDGVEVHGAHGYLLCQFLSRHNARDDRWGGSLENRARIVREILRGIRARCGGAFIVGVRLSPEDFGFAVGMDLDESVTCARWFCEDGVDFVHLSLWDHEKPAQKRADEDVIALFRRSIDGEVRVIVAGKVWTPSEARAVLARGADLVALGRAAIMEPDWPLRARDPSFQPARGPMTERELEERAVSVRFAQYLRRFKGVVREE